MQFASSAARHSVLVLLLWLAGPAWADEIRVITSGGFTAAYQKLVPLYEAATQDHVITAYGASMGNAPDSIPSRLARGEAFDVVILADSGLDKLVTDGKGGSGEPG
ncbi:substrate-binding domain-containing protein [Cupriavidus basilensis]